MEAYKEWGDTRVLYSLRFISVSASWIVHVHHIGGKPGWIGGGYFVWYGELYRCRAFSLVLISELSNEFRVSNVLFPCMNCSNVRKPASNHPISVYHTDPTIKRPHHHRKFHPYFIDGCSCYANNYP